MGRVGARSAKKERSTSNALGHRKAEASAQVHSHMAVLVELTSAAALTLAGWLAGALLRSGVERNWRRLRTRRLDAVSGRRVGERVHHPSGAFIALVSERRGCRLLVTMPLKGLPGGLRIEARQVFEGSRRDPVEAALGLALVREGLLRPELGVTSASEEVRVSQWTEALPTVARMEGLADRVARAVALATRYLAPHGTEAGSRRAAVSGLLAADPRVRLVAAENAGSLGVPVLRTLFLDPKVSMDVRSRAGRAFGSRARAQELRETCQRVMRQGPDPLARFAAEECVAREAPSALVELLPRARPVAQRVLLNHLVHAACAEAYPALDALLSRGGLGVRMDGPLRRAWRAAKSCRDESRGGLALARAEGALSAAIVTGTAGEEASTSGEPEDS